MIQPFRTYLAKIRIGVMLLLILAVCSCSPRRYMVGELTDMMLAGMAAQEQDTDLEMVQAAMPANIKLLESLLASSPANRDLLILLSRQYAGYVFSRCVHPIHRPAGCTGPVLVRV